MKLTNFPYFWVCCVSTIRWILRVNGKQIIAACICNRLERSENKLGVIHCPPHYLLQTTPSGFMAGPSSSLNCIGEGTVRVIVTPGGKQKNLKLDPKAIRSVMFA